MSSAVSSAMKIAPSAKPSTGEISIGTTSFGQSPVLHCKTLQSMFVDASAAPQSPPTSAWLELDGRPSHQVSRFQTIAPMSAARMLVMVIACGFTIPAPTVFATAVPRNAPSKLKNAASAMAWRGVSTFVETTVAIAFAAS